MTWFVCSMGAFVPEARHMQMWTFRPRTTSKPIGCMIHQSLSVVGAHPLRFLRLQFFSAEPGGAKAWIASVTTSDNDYQEDKGLKTLLSSANFTHPATLLSSSANLSCSNSSAAPHVNIPSLRTNMHARHTRRRTRQLRTRLMLQLWWMDFSSCFFLLSFANVS